MLLSPQEQARLDELEKQLSIEDPALARKLRFETDRRSSTAGSVTTVLGALAGGLLLILGIATQNAVVGIIAFLAMGAALYWFVQKRWPENQPWQ